MMEGQPFPAMVGSRHKPERKGSSMIKQTTSHVPAGERHLPVRACMLAYLAATRGGRNPLSQRHIQGNLLCFADYCESASVGVEGVNARIVASFTEHLKDAHKARKRGETVMSSVTIAGYVQNIKSALLWASGDELVYSEYVNEKTIKRIVRPKRDEVIIETFTDTHIRQLLTACKAEENPKMTARAKMCIHLLYSTGIRASELCHLRLPDVHLEPVAGLQQLFRRLASRAGITDMRVSPHNFRHTFSANALRAGMDIYTLQRLLGHSSTSITEHYIKSLGADFDLHDRAVRFMP